MTPSHFNKLKRRLAFNSSGTPVGSSLCPLMWVSSARWRQHSRSEPSEISSSEKSNPRSSICLFTAATSYTTPAAGSLGAATDADADDAVSYIAGPPVPVLPPDPAIAYTFRLAAGLSDATAYSTVCALLPDWFLVPRTDIISYIVREERITEQRTVSSQAIRPSRGGGHLNEVHQGSAQHPQPSTYSPAAVA